MDPCSFLRLLVGNLALKFPVASRPARSGVHPSSTPCFCKITLDNRSHKIASLPVLPPVDSTARVESGLAAAFHLSRKDIDRLCPTSVSSGKATLKVFIYTGRRGSTCWVNSGRLLGKVKVPLDIRSADGRAVLFHSGWFPVVGKSSKGGASAQLHLTVKSEPDPRFVFEFGQEPECSPQVFHIQGSLRQPVFTCKFSCRNPAADFNVRSRSFPREMGSRRKWLRAFGSEREKPGKERKGWSVTVHDLSGSPVAMASMVTPFVASPGTDRVSRSNPGAWLVLRPGGGTWKPWGRLEAWRERANDALGYRFELLPDARSMPCSSSSSSSSFGASSSCGGEGVLVAESAISISKGGQFSIDLTGTGGSRTFSGQRGLVMSSTVGAEGRAAKPPVVEIGAQHVGCAEDAAAFVALAAAIDLSVDACSLFSARLRKELQPQAHSGDTCFW